MKNTSYSILIIFLLISCDDPKVEEISTLDQYMDRYSLLEEAEVIACAAGKPDGLMGSVDYPTDIFFYPVEGAKQFTYFESLDIDNPEDFSNYSIVDLEDKPIFNGYLRKFIQQPFSGERMAIVAYQTEDSLHLSNPIRLKTNTKPTEVNSDLVTVNPQGINPKFVWEDGVIDENAIYFQVISDEAGNLISGTYTFDREFTFYDLENVVLNITDPTVTPELSPNTQYNFTMMAVSLDNWVNLLIEVPFTTQ